jgi:hypothetical protein
MSSGNLSHPGFFLGIKDVELTKTNLAMTMILVEGELHSMRDIRRKVH